MAFWLKDMMQSTPSRSKVVQLLLKWKCNCISLSTINHSSVNILIRVSNFQLSQHSALSRLCLPPSFTLFGIESISSLGRVFRWGHQRPLQGFCWPFDHLRSTADWVAEEPVVHPTGTRWPCFAIGVSYYQNEFHWKGRKPLTTTELVLMEMLLSFYAEFLKFSLISPKSRIRAAVSDDQCGIFGDVMPGDVNVMMMMMESRITENQ